jgi:flagellar biosynthesis/type III secretory pathway M-ring protein FliF/YscJ
VSVANPSGGATAANQKMSEEQRKTVEKQFVVPKTVEKTTIKGGRVKKLTVAVTIAKKADGASWTPQELANFEELVSAAVGIDNYFTPDELKKNQVVTVKEMPFIPIKAEEPAAVAITDKIMFEINKYSQSPLIRPVLGFFLLIILYRIFRKYFNKTSVEGADFGFGSVASGGVYGEDVKKIETEEPPEPNERDLLLDSLNQKSQASPQTVADILERWLASEQG